MFKKYVFLFSSLIIGITSGWTFLYVLPRLPISRNHQLNKLFGIKKPQVIGFLPYWQLDKTSPDYQSSITTLTYFGLTLDTDGRIVQLTTPQEEEPGWHTLRSEKATQHLTQARQAKLTLSLLIHNSDESSISALMKNPIVNARNLISDVAPLMQKYGFTDLNLDIESFMESSPSSQVAFTRFLSEVRIGIDEHKLGTLTVEMSPTALVKPLLINPVEVARIADFVVLMAYDYHYSGSFTTGPVAPIGGVPQSREFDITTSIVEAKKVIPPEKLILGIPFYGYEWETIGNSPGAPTIPGGASTASNRRVEELIKTCTNCQISFDEITQSPRIVFPDESDTFFHQIYYEEEQSLQKKLDLANSSQLSGIALWALGYEGEKILTPINIYKNTTSSFRTLR